MCMEIFRHSASPAAATPPSPAALNLASAARLQLSHSRHVCCDTQETCMLCHTCCLVWTLGLVLIARDGSTWATSGCMVDLFDP